MIDVLLSDDLLLLKSFYFFNIDIFAPLAFINIKFSYGFFVLKYNFTFLPNFIRFFLNIIKRMIGSINLMSIEFMS